MQCTLGGAQLRRMAKLIPHNWAVPTKFRERLGENAGRQRAMLHEGHLLLVLHEVPKPSDPERRPAIFWRAPDGAWKASSGRGGLSALRDLVESFAKVSLELEKKLDEARRASDYFEVLSQSGPLLRTARNQHKALQEAREGVASDRDLILVRDTMSDVERTAELIQFDAKNGLDFTIARRSEEQAVNTDHILETNHRLNLLAALFFPVTALGSILGMNLVSGYETRNAPWLFWATTVFAILIGLLVRASFAAKNPRRN